MPTKKMAGKGDSGVTGFAAFFVVLGQAYPPPVVDPVSSMVNSVGFLAVAFEASGEQVAGVCRTAHACWNDVIDCVCLGTAVGAGVCVAFEDVCTYTFPVWGLEVWPVVAGH